MHRIPTIFRAYQYSYARCIHVIAQNRLRCSTLSLPATNLYSNKRCIYSYKTEGKAARQNNPGPAISKRRTAQHDNSTRRSKTKSPIPLGIRLNGVEELHPSSQHTVSDKISSWERRIVTIRHSHGDQGVWDMFLQLRNEGDAHLVTEPRAEFLRDSILKAALTHADRMEEVFTFAQELQKTYHFEWPELYLKVVHFYLAQTDCEAAFRWHLKLMPTFRPDLNSFGAFLASFAIDSSPITQSTLTRIYVFNPYRELYDYVVPTLFESGQSHAARVWRKRFILFNDHAMSQKSMPFLDFLSRYFPSMQLTKEESAILNRDTGVDDGPPLDTANNDSRSNQHMGKFSDTFTARWFASSWTSSEFAINLMHKLGLRVIGSQSLQSVALREQDAQGVNDRLAQFRELGIAISPTVYCKAVTSFAERGEDELLRSLLHCDIHPDEFDNSETRVMLLAASAKQQDWRRERLLQEVEALIAKPAPRKDKTLSEELNNNLRAALSTQGLAKVRSVFDKMDNLSISIEQKNSEVLLDRVFEGIWYHPKTSKQKIHGFQEDPKLDRAIHLSLRVAQHGVAIPIRYWQILLYNLGRLGRFNELEELSYQICDLYSPEPGGLIPVHRCDIPPKPKSKSRTSNSDTGGWAEYYSFPDGKKKISHFREEFWKAEIGLTKEEPNAILTEAGPATKSGNLLKKGNDPEYAFCIPADLPFTNRQHPIQKIFDISLQRAILRWGFDKTLGQEPAQLSLARLKPGGVADFDLACGVRLLALLRDKGVYIDQQVVRSAIIQRLAVAHLPGRGRARARDDRELSPSNIKQLVEKAWGSVILPSETQLALEIENIKPKLWKSFPRLFEKSYDKDEPS